MSTQPLIHLTDITQTFPTADKPVLNKVNLTVYPGDYLAIIGPSGSGKSTLLNVLGLLSRPSTGSYRLEGVETTGITEAGRDALRRNTIGFIFQSSNMLLDETALTNSSMSLRVQGAPRSSRAIQAGATLQAIGLSHRENTPAKYLSGGEKQRCAIARAVAGSPTLILADEPTGNLDSENTAKVLSTLADLHKTGHTLIIITHDPAIAATAPRRASIIDGVLTEEPSPETTVRQKTKAQDASTPTPPGVGRKRNGGQDPQQKPLLSDDLFEAISAIITRPIRSALLALSFALGVGGLIASLGLSSSAAYQVNQRMLGSEQQVVNATVQTTENVLSNYRSGASASDYVEALTQLSYVEKVGYQAMIAPADIRITRFSALDREPDTAIALVSVNRGRLEQLGATVTPSSALQTLSTMNGSLSLDSVTDRELATSLGAGLITPGAARALGIYDEATQGLSEGTGVWVDGHYLPVTGLIDFGEEAPELANALLAPPAVLAANGRYQVLYTIHTEPGYTRAVSQAVPFVLAPTAPADVTTETPSSLADLRADVSEDLGLFVGILSGILLALASLSAGTSMYLSVQSRTSEIALRRAIGASKGLIARLFIFEGLALGFIGGSLGAAAGVLATVLLSSTQGWQVVLSPTYPLIGASLGCNTGLFSSLYPALVASRKDPADAMRA
ncbi:MAG: ATP-binding cassette domain-containing protein [Rothia sp. (in: high G+C Gram-positive bacteria)]|uniref:ABC transporter ATP-binding protein/permease n=1 Tax=Rothia sp. (in: high G+C Gram-positive bacteria) TaxID=1885016 RepID=UPI0027119F1D|nr:ATP-binding cassette domain-containing protein [Rothia sp. (in: high G+C Gram-positive bacteria)]